MAEWLSPGRAFGALLAALSVASACGGGSSTDAGKTGTGGSAGVAGKGNGGSSGEGETAGAPTEGGRGGTLDSAGGNADSGNGVAGSGNESGGESGGSTSSAPGTLDSIWKRTQADVLVFDSAKPTAIPQQVTVDVPGIISVPDADTSDDVEVYESIQNDVLITYAHVSGASSYYLIKKALSGASGVYSYSLDSTLSGIFQLQNGSLTFTASFSMGTVTGTTTTHYDQYTGTFPPPAWPNTVVTLDLTSGGAP
jgi:hypothetical protein